MTGLESAVMAAENFCFYLQNRLIQTSPTGGQQYSDTSPFSVPWLNCQKQKTNVFQSGKQPSSITDCETISRPPSALTSYSNFHGQRRPAISSGPNQKGHRAENFTSLTQESLTNHHIRPFGASGGPISNNFQVPVL